jgi:hypothetical protein
MALPTPQQFRDLIISEGDSVCDQLRKVATFSKLSSDLIAEIYKEDGDLTDSFLALVCALDCTGTGGPGASTSTTTTATTLAPGAVVDNSLYSFVTTLDGSGFLESNMYVLDGDTYDTQEIVSVSRQVSIASNVTIMSAALHPTTGVLYVIGADGTLQTSQIPVTLYTVDTVTGVLTSLGAMTIASSGLPFYWFPTANTTLNQRRLRFDPSDNQAYVLEVTGSDSFLFELDLGTQVISNPLDLGVVGVVDVSDQIAFDIQFGSSGTPYTASETSFGTFSLTPDGSYPTSLPTTYGGNFAPAAALNSMFLRNSRFSYIVANGPSLMRTDATPGNVETLAPATSLGQSLSGIFGGKMPVATAYLAT